MGCHLAKSSNEEIPLPECPPKYHSVEKDTLPTKESIEQYRKVLIDKGYEEFKRNVIDCLKSIPKGIERNQGYVKHYIKLNKEWGRSQITHYCERFNGENITNLEVSIENDKKWCFIDTGPINWDT